MTAPYKTRKISAHTTQIDLGPLARAYLIGAGLYHRGRKVGEISLWVAYRGRKQVAAGPTEQSVIEKAEAHA